MVAILLHDFQQKQLNLTARLLVPVSSMSCGTMSHSPNCSVLSGTSQQRDSGMTANNMWLGSSVVD
jgi:hypothetical protein